MPFRYYFPYKSYQLSYQVKDLPKVRDKRSGVPSFDEALCLLGNAPMISRSLARLAPSGSGAQRC